MNRHAIFPLLLAPIFLLLALASTEASAQACPMPGTDRAALDVLKLGGFTVADARKRQSLAIALLDCLDAPDPALRDGIAFDALSSWLRGDLLTVGTRATIRDRLVARLAPGAPDGDGFGKPFAALALSEIARTDLVSPWLTAAERNVLVETAANTMLGIRDYRGFDDHDGWRHGVAHDADLMMQLARNRALEKPQLDRLLAAIATQVAPASGHAYVFGEPERLVRPVLFIAARGLVTDAERAAWFTRISDPSPNASWADAASSTAGLARRHDLRAFLLALHLAAMDSPLPAVKVFASDAHSLLKTLD